MLTLLIDVRKLNTRYDVPLILIYLFFDLIFLTEVIDPIKSPVNYVAGYLKVGASSIRRWKSQQLTRESLERLPSSGRPTKRFPAWAHISIRNIIIGLQPHYNYRRHYLSTCQCRMMLKVLSQIKSNILRFSEFLGIFQVCTELKEAKGKGNIRQPKKL